MFNNNVLIFGAVFFLIVSIGMFTIFTPIAQTASILEQTLKTFGIGFVVDKFAGQINSFINTLTLNQGVEIKKSTKVVPIVTVGSGTYAGAVQVSGPTEAVKKVEAVAQLEGNFKDGAFRVRALVPVNTKNPVNIKNIDRIEGVGITAMIDINI